MKLKLTSFPCPNLVMPSFQPFLTHILSISDERHAFGCVKF